MATFGGFEYAQIQDRIEVLDLVFFFGFFMYFIFYWKTFLGFFVNFEGFNMEM